MFIVFGGDKGLSRYGLWEKCLLHIHTVHMYPQTIPDASLPTLYHYFTISISFEKAILWIVKFPL
jgi:hypothetical protein